MKLLSKILITGLFVFLALKLLIPYHKYPIEHFEYFLVNATPLSWKLTAVVSRLLVGCLFLVSFLVLFGQTKLKWLSFTMFALPFIINPLYFDSVQDNTMPIKEKLVEDIAIAQSGEVLLAYLSYNCLHCTEALYKLEAAKVKSTSFPEVKIVSYNNKLSTYLVENDLPFKVDSISPKTFYEQTGGSFPKFAFIKNGEIIKKYSAAALNYAALDNLSK